MFPILPLIAVQNAQTAVRCAQITTQMASMAASRRRMGARSTMHVNDGGGWRPRETAPLDGTAVEIKNSYGVAPTYSLSKWDGRYWQHVNNPNSGTCDGAHVSWRPYSGDPAAYVDPTGGAQDTVEYWDRAVIQATGGLLNPAVERAKNKRRQDPEPLFSEAESWIIPGLLLGVVGGGILVAVALAMS